MRSGSRREIPQFSIAVVEPEGAARHGQACQQPGVGALPEIAVAEHHGDGVAGIVDQAFDLGGERGAAGGFARLVGGAVQRSAERPADDVETAAVEPVGKLLGDRVPQPCRRIGILEDHDQRQHAPARMQDRHHAGAGDDGGNGAVDVELAQFLLAVGIDKEIDDRAQPLRVETRRQRAADRAHPEGEAWRPGRFATDGRIEFGLGESFFADPSSRDQAQDHQDGAEQGGAGKGGEQPGDGRRLLGGLASGI